MTLTGFDATNPLKAMSDLNLRVGGRACNVVEMTHKILRLGLCDLIVGAAEHSAS